ncbi:hypothetical protein RBB50_011522 [Rhinocladiella similis]
MSLGRRINISSGRSQYTLEARPIPIRAEHADIDIEKLTIGIRYQTIGSKSSGKPTIASTGTVPRVEIAVEIAIDSNVSGNASLNTASLVSATLNPPLGFYFGPPVTFSDPPARCSMGKAKRAYTIRSCNKRKTQVRINRHAISYVPSLLQDPSRLPTRLLKAANKPPATLSSLPAELTSLSITS